MYYAERFINSYHEDVKIKISRVAVIIRFHLKTLYTNMRLETGTSNGRGPVLSLDIPGAFLFLGMLDDRDNRRDSQICGV
jgi:hypothetical protein